MNLSTSILNELDQNSKIDKHFFLEVIATKNLPFLVYKDTYTGYPWGEWERVSERIEELAFKYNFFDDYDIPNDKDHLFNLFYFFPNYATRLHSNVVDELLSLPWSSLTFLLNKKVICQLFVKYISSSSIKDSFLQSYLGILWAANKFELLSNTEEIQLINRIISNTNVNNIFRKLIVKRLNSLKETEEFRKEIKLTYDKPSCAIIVSGQFRFSSDIKELLNLIIKQESINVTGIFIASWNKVGGIDTSQEQKIYRYLDQEVILRVKKGDIDINAVIKKLDNISNEIDTNKISSSLNIPIMTKLNNEAEYPYNSMLNPEKMYFNNAYWVKTLGEDYFINNFDFIFKIRPDINIKELDLSSCVDRCEQVFAEEGWIFRTWGFGMGDQVIFGSSSNVVKLLSTHAEKEVIELVTTLYPHSKGYMGHINLGICAWYKNMDVNKMPVFKHHLNVPPKLTLEKLDM